jgi:superfamily I DNA/RNA helicase
MIREDRWRPADGLTLEPNALVAAREPMRNVALTAGPGAGKTELLAQRADFLLRTGLCPYPQRILAISFKVDAAFNIKERVRRRCGAQLAARFDSHTFHAFAKRLIDRFRPVLTGTDALDADYTIGEARIERRQIGFVDMVPLALQIIRASRIAVNAVRQTYGYAFLDEFQDCTREQYQLVREMFLQAGTTLTAVGDTKQRIMGWAGALEGIHQTFATDFDAVALNLYQNFRAAPRLRRMQNEMVRVMEPSAALDDAQIGGEGGSVEVLELADDTEEARVVADRIEALHREGQELGEIAVLFAKQPELFGRPLMAELRTRNIAYRDERNLQDIATEPIARLITAFLSVVVSDRQPEAFTHLEETLFSEEDVPSGRHSTRRRWLAYIDEQRATFRQGTLNPSSLLRDIGNAFVARLNEGLVRGLSPDYAHGDRATVVAMETLARLHELAAQSDDPAKALRTFERGNAVRIMSVHKSKGLEFAAVFFLGIENETFFGKLADERSVFFVGVSRAKGLLGLTAAAHRARPDGHMRFWTENRTPQAEFLGYATQRSGAS